MHRFITILILMLVCAAASAQADRKFIREGNRLYRQKQFDAAERSYRQAVASNPNNAVAQYNLGCAQMMLRKDSLAAVQFVKSGEMQKDRYRRSMSYHNLGVIFQNNQQYEQAIEAYKESLRCNPTDNQTRYNLALCQKMLKKQPKQNPPKQQQQQQQQSGNQQNQQNQSQQQQKDEQNQQQQSKQQQEQQGQMSRENAERLLNAAIQEEKNTKKKIEKQAHPAQARQPEKNW